MRLTRPAVLAGLVSFAMAGSALAAGTPELNSMELRLPDGSIAHIRYAGDTPPRVTIAPRPVARWATPAWGWPWDDAQFARLQRIAAEMDRRMDAMMRMAFAARGDGTPQLTFVSGNHPGSAGYSFVSRTTNDGSCVRSIQVTRAAGDAEPKVVRRTSGDCGAVAPAPSNAETI
jgi:hypothetical protein